MILSLVLVCIRTLNDSVAVECIEHDFSKSVFLCHVVTDVPTLIKTVSSLSDCGVWNFDCIFDHNKKGINLTYTSIIIGRGEKSTKRYI